MTSKSSVFTFLLATFGLLGGVLGTLYIIDPLKLFHTPWFYKDHLHSNMRLQAAGIINNYDFDSVILGTSMLQNTSAREASEVLGGTFFNISMSGSDFYERGIVLEYLLRKKQIKTVLYSLDYSGLVDARRGTPVYVLGSFDYLYDRNPFNDINAYLNDRYLECLVRFNSECMGRKTDFDRPNAWFNIKDQARRFGGLDHWFKAHNHLRIRKTFRKIVTASDHIRKHEVQEDPKLELKLARTRKYLDETLFEAARLHPDIRFVMIIPPYSRLRNAINAQYKKPVFTRIKVSIEYLVMQSAKYDNMEIYGWGDASFPDDIANYKDMSHYHPDINSMMLQDIQKGAGRLTPQNVRHYLTVFEQRALQYDVHAIADRVREYLAATKPTGKKRKKQQNPEMDVPIDPEEPDI